MNKYKVVRFIAKQYAGFVFHRKPKPVDLGLDTPFFLVSNHQTDFDIAIMASDIKNPFRPVASEHVLHKGFAGKLMMKLLNPITVTKGSVKVSSVRQMLKAIKNGDSLMIHPEGTRTFDGKTMDFGIEIGKVIKTSKAGLVTYRISGGYLCTPKWALNNRKGSVRGNIVNIYSADEVNKMTPEEITDIIKGDIYTNDYEENEKYKLKYYSDKLAEGIENLIFICPKCGKVGTLYGKGNFALCECGFKSEMDEYCCFDDNEKTVINWANRQINQFLDIYNDNICFSDENISLMRIEPDHSRTMLAEGCLKGTKSGLSIGEFDFEFRLFEDDFELIGHGNTGYFTVGGVHFVLSSERANLYKYQLLFQKSKNITLHT